MTGLSLLVTIVFIFAVGAVVYGATTHVSSAPKSGGGGLDETPSGPRAEE